MLSVMMPHRRCVLSLISLAILLVGLRHAPASAAPVDVVSGVSPEATAANSQRKLVFAGTTVYLAYAAMDGDAERVGVATSPDGRTWLRLPLVAGLPSRLPTLAVDPQDGLHLAWTAGTRPGSVLYSRLVGGAWTPPLRLSPAEAYAGVPAMVAAREVDVVWYGIRGGRPEGYSRHDSIYEIFHTAFDGQRWSPPRLISPGSQDALNPALVADARGTLHAFWYQSDGRVYRVRRARLRGGVWEVPQAVTGGGGDAIAPAAVADGRGNIHLAWESREAPARIYYQRVAGDGWDAPVALSPPGSGAHRPVVTVDREGTVYVAWAQDDGHLYLRRRPRLSGTILRLLGMGRRSWRAPERLSASGVNDYPALAAGPLVVAAWTHAGEEGRTVQTAVVPRRAPVSPIPVLVGPVLVLLVLVMIVRRYLSRPLASRPS
ncbi:MAG: hypothetical protein HY660_10510 [Armatimonadetes bacterium]|nr:hypothetical protein [Armatimonadota bacterium]